MSNFNFRVNHKSNKLSLNIILKHLKVLSLLVFKKIKMNKFFKGIIYTVDKLIVLAFAASLLLSFVASHLNVVDAPWLFIFGLLTPFLYLVNIVMFLILVIRLSFWCCVPLIVLAINLSNILGYYSVNVFKEYDKNEKTIKVMTYNVRNFKDDNWKSTTDSLVTYIKSHKPDILCLQEYISTHGYPLDSLREYLLPLNYVHLSLNEPYDGSGKYGRGVVTFSKYPIVRRKDIVLDSCRYSNAQYSDLLFEGDTLRVFNLHLQTTGIDHEDRVLINSERDSSRNGVDSLEKQQVKNILKKVMANNAIRMEQADTIALYIKKRNYTTIVCGDFNDYPASYTYTTIKKSLNFNDAFRERGSGYGYTFNDFFNTLRIDYMLCTDDIEILKYTSEDKPWSDHNPVVVEFRKR